MEFSSEEQLLRAAQSLKKHGTLADPIEVRRQEEMKRASFEGTILMCRQHVLQVDALVIHKFLHHKAAPGELTRTFQELSTKHPEAFITLHRHTPNSPCTQNTSCLAKKPAELNPGPQAVKESNPPVGPLREPQNLKINFPDFKLEF